MIRQQTREVYYLLTRYLNLPNYYPAKLRFAFRAPANGYYLHLACGKVYIPGMVNIDGNMFRKTDLWLDFRNGLPFPNGSASFVYCCNSIQHILPDDVIGLLREIRRVLRPDGVARITTICFEYALEIAAGKTEFRWPRSFDDPLGQAINYLFCDGHCKYAYSFGVLASLAQQAGFREVIHYSREHGCQPKRYANVEVGNEPKDQLVVELRP
jgi:prepilin-type processing-associated H-X9-DG protein